MADVAKNFERDGFVVIDTVLDASMVHQLRQCLVGEGSVGARNLLALAPVQSAARHIRACPRVGPLLANRVAVQCTSFIKSQSKNWAVRLHRDRVVPAWGGEGWPASGTKDDMEFVRPPREILQGMIAVRLNLDEADEGDLQVVPGSHCRSTNSKRSEAMAIPVRQGGALVMRPLLEHASTKLKHTDARRVLHFVFGSTTLPQGYNWYHAV